VIRILDLFCGLGGVARGFQRYLIEHEIEFEYHAVDNNPQILRAHKFLNPYSKTFYRDAWSFTDEELLSYDFVWASPPCETHSTLMCYYNRNSKKWKPPDMRLWELISHLFKLGVPFVVENVRPYYGFPILPTARAGRHYLWSNLALKSVEANHPKFEDIKDDTKRLLVYHTVPRAIVKVLRGRKLRDALRDMMHWKLAYKIAEQVIPMLLGEKKMVVQARLEI